MQNMYKNKNEQGTKLTKLQTTAITHLLKIKLSPKKKSNKKQNQNQTTSCTECYYKVKTDDNNDE
jgi:hypothetical protein